MAYRDLREWLEQAEKIGELTRINGVHWDLEAGAVCALSRTPVLFDDFPGYPKGYRLLGLGLGMSLRRFLITAGWSTEAIEGIALVRAWRERLREFKPVPPQRVEHGPILENFHTGKEVDLLKFPVPRGHDLDGGRYIGMGHSVITRDPDTGRVNFGIYRMQAHDATSTGMHISEGKDGRIIMDKYHQRGQPCPMVAVVGIDPGLMMASAYHLVHEDGSTELDFAGWLKGYPEEVIEGKLTGLPIPARAEIALEGEVAPGDRKLEGPFAEWTGYSQRKEAPVFRVKAIYHRNDPILTASLGWEVRPPGKAGLRSDFTNAALLWSQLEKAGVRGIQGVGFFRRRLTVISIDNLYAGHSRQAGIIASQCHAGSYGGAYIIVVDKDVDPTNIQDVMWAVSTRTEPSRAIQVLDYCWASHLTIQDPIFVQKREYAMRAEKATYMSRVVIDACKPLEWDPSWHRDVFINPELKKKALQKWGNLIQPEEG